MKASGAVSRSLSLFKGRGISFRNKESGKLGLPQITSGNTVKAIGYKEFLIKINSLRDALDEQLNNIDRSTGQYLWLSLYVLALSAQERMVDSMNDDLIASDIPWDSVVDTPSISSTIGDAVSYAERLKDPKDHFLKSLLLSFSGWALFSTEKKECACGKSNLKEIPVDILVNTSLTAVTNSSSSGLALSFVVGVKSDDQEHLEGHYSFKKKSIRDDGLIIIHDSRGGVEACATGRFRPYREMCSDSLNQAEQFRANKMAEILDRLINSFSKEA